MLPLAGCGGGTSPSTPSTPTTPANPNTFTLTAAGVTPKELTVSPGSRVLFRNNDARSHDMASDPHPSHGDCDELNIGLLSSGQSRESLNLVTVRTCGFHDHGDSENVNLQGRVIIR